MGSRLSNAEQANVNGSGIQRNYGSFRERENTVITREAIPFGPEPNPSECLLPLYSYFLPRFSIKSFIFWMTVIDLTYFFLELVYGLITIGNISGAFSQTNMRAGPNTETLIACGAGISCSIPGSGSICGGQIYRFLTSIVVSHGFTAVVPTAWLQMYLGFVLELRWGTPCFMIIYFVTGIGGPLLLATTAPISLFQGQVCVIFGMLGANFTYLSFNRDTIPGIWQEVCCMMFIFFWFALEYSIMVWLGGFLLGIFLATFLCPKLVFKPWHRIAKGCGILATLIYFVTLPVFLFAPGYVCSQCL